MPTFLEQIERGARRGAEGGVDAALGPVSGGFLDFDTIRLAINESPLNDAVGVPDVPDVNEGLDQADPWFPSLGDTATGTDPRARWAGEALDDAVPDFPDFPEVPGEDVPWKLVGGAVVVGAGLWLARPALEIGANVTEGD